MLLAMEELPLFSFMINKFLITGCMLCVSSVFSANAAHAQYTSTLYRRSCNETGTTTSNLKTGETNRLLASMLASKLLPTVI